MVFLYVCGMRIGSDFSGVGAFDQALMRLGIEYQTIFACDMDKYARQTYIENYGEPAYYPENVYDREIPQNPLDIYMTSPPCQSFSLAGKRGGESDKRGVLFYNSHEFIVKNSPRFFIFENVKGLLSDANGRTFQIWCDMLGGKSVNGNPVLFPREDATPYHIYHKVLNAKHYGVPQNRERIFIIGIRDDQDNNFSFPKPFHLEKRLKDVLESEVNEKYYLSDKMINFFIENTKNNKEKGNGFAFNPKKLDEYANAVTTRSGSRMDDNFIKVKSATKQGFEVAKEGDSINFSQPNSETRRGRVGKEVAQTLDTACNQGVFLNENQLIKFNSLKVDENVAGCITNAMGRAGSSDEYMASIKRNAIITQKIRRLTPIECFRLMDFPDSFKMPCSDTQMYKQAGNSIVVNVLAEIIKKLKF